MLFVTSHSPEVLSTEQYDYIYALIDSVERNISTDDKDNREWERIIDIDSLACFYIVNEVLDNIEAFHGSCWIHKERGPATKLIFGPVWDFGNAYNRPIDEMDFIYNQKEPRHYSSHWIDRISTFNHFQERVAFHWQRIKDADALDIDAFVDDFLTVITPAAALDYERWHNNSENLRRRAGAFMEMFNAKVAWLDERWSGNSGIKDLTADNSAGPVIVTDVLGRVITTTPAGSPLPSLEPGRVYFIRQGTSCRKVIVR